MLADACERHREAGNGEPVRSSCRPVPGDLETLDGASHPTRPWKAAVEEHGRHTAMKPAERE